MFQAQIGKHLIPRFFQRLFRVVPQIPAVILSGYASGKPGLFPRATINQTLVSAVRDKFRCRVLSLIVWNVSAHFTTGFVSLLYNKLEEKYKIRNALLRHQF
ncbi:MAG: hypothetical protein ACR2MG_20975 [Pyrinomonadaceae bacterium]